PLAVALTAAAASAPVAFGLHNSCKLENRDTSCVGDSATEWLTTGAGNDMLNGEGGNDRLNAQGGDDVLYGGPGNDTLHAGRGNDEIFSRDGKRDTVVCGSGHDVAKVDHKDKVAGDCEQVIRIG